MSVSDTKKTSYFNTLIFTIISGILSLALLTALFFDIFKQYIPFIITVEIGIFAIIIYSIYRIYTNEKRYDQIKNDRNFAINFRQCPDYYVTKTIDDKTICSNEYIMENKYRKKEMIKIYPADVEGSTSYTFPSVHNPNFVNSANPQEKFEIDSFAANPTLPTNQKKCEAVFGNNNQFVHYSKLPWTSVKSRCNSYINM